VTLSGHVATYWEKRLAERAALQSLASDSTVPKDRITLKVEDAWSVPGVTEVNDTVAIGF